MPVREGAIADGLATLDWSSGEGKGISRQNQ